jgi:S-DNA-T family DNA segregation ATPase FtsK/SpoIIIE
MLGAALLCLAMNLDPTATEFRIFDRSIAGSRWNGVLEAIAQSLSPVGFSVEFCKDPAGAAGFVNELIDELNRRKAKTEEELLALPSVFITMTELDTIESIRRKPDAYGLGAMSALGEGLQRLYLEGPPLGMHLILSFSGVRPMVNVVDERRGLVNFRHRVALQMSEDDSHILTRGRKASQLQVEGPTPICALYLDVEIDTGVRFKPYSIDAALVAQNQSLIDQLPTISNELSKRRK